MAAGDTLKTREGCVGGMRLQTWEITTNGVTGVAVNTGFHRVNAVSATFTQDIGAAATTLECTISGGTVTVTCAIAVSKTASVVVYGDP